MVWGTLLSTLHWKFSATAISESEYVESINMLYKLWLEICGTCETSSKPEQDLIFFFFNLYTHMSLMDSCHCGI